MNFNKYFPLIIFLILFPAFLAFGLFFFITRPESSATQRVAGTSTPIELLTQSWSLAGNNGASERYQSLSKNVLSGMDTLTVTYNLHGLCALGGDASAIVFDQNGWKYISLSNYGQNCKDGEQTVTIPLSDFKGLDTNAPLTGSFHTRFWNSTQFKVDILSAVLKEKETVSTPVTPPPTSSSIPELQNKTELLTQAWSLVGNNGAGEKYQSVNKNILKEKDTILITFDLHGLCALSGDASALIFDQNGWRYISLSNYGEKCRNGQQTVSIPLLEFNGLDTTKPLTGSLHTRFWYGKAFQVDITSVIVGTSAQAQKTPVPEAQPSQPQPPTQPVPTPVPTPAPEPSPTQQPQPVSQKTWDIQSVDAMKYTKDVICSPKDEVWIGKWVDKAVEIGATHVAVSTPYDNPKCGNAVEYTKTWIRVIRSKGLHVFHRQMPLQFEGIYDNPKSPGTNFITQVSNYIKANKENYQEGDIFTPVPEPQNGGIAGVSYCAQNTCIFNNASSFNKWLRDITVSSRDAFASIGLKDKVKVGYYGFDGYIAWGHNNPDWQGKGFLENDTVNLIGHIAVDHYPEAVGTSMGPDLEELEKRFPGIPIIIGEWGTIGGGDTEQQVRNSMGGAKKSSVVGFNYWHLGPGGNEALINNDFSNRPQFDEVQLFYKPK